MNTPTPLPTPPQTTPTDTELRADFLLLWKSKLASVLLTLTPNPGDTWRYQHIAWLAFKAGKGQP